MQIKHEKTRPRREFLKIAAVISGSVLIGGGGIAIFSNEKKQDMLTELWRLNPAFRIKTISKNEIEIFTNLKNGGKLQHRFRGMEADLLRHISNEQKINPIIPSLSNKYNLSVEDCEEKINQSLHDFCEANLIYSGEKMLVKIVEAPND